MKSSNLTIVILTFNRYPYLKRLLGYFLDYRKNQKILVLDSSSDQISDSKLLEILEYENVDWKRFSSDIFLSDKINQGIKNIYTKYAVLCAEDDFLIPSSLRECIAFLDRNESYTSAHGLYVYHKHHNENSNHKIIWDVLYPFAKSNKRSSPFMRFKKFFPSNYASYPLYAVHRTNVLKDIWEKTSKSCNDWGWVEIIPSCLSIIQGKSKKLPIFYASKQANDYFPLNKQRHNQMFSRKKNEAAKKMIELQLIKYSSCKQKKAKSLIRRHSDIYQNKAQKKEVKVFSNHFTYYLRHPYYFISRIKGLLIKRFIISSIFKHDLKKVHDLILSSDLSIELINKTRKTYKN